MFSDTLTKLFANGMMTEAIWATVYMTIIATVASYVIGLPLGVILYVTKQKGLAPCNPLNVVLGFVINLLRSIPFIILTFAVFPLTKIIAGTTMGNGAMIVTLIIGAAPYVARMVESSLLEVDGGVIEAAESMGASTFEIILKVLIPEAKPALVTGAIISTITVLGYSAMASTIGGGGLGAIAYTFGYQTSTDDVTWICVAFTVIIVQLIQACGNLLVKKIDKRIKK